MISPSICFSLSDFFYLAWCPQRSFMLLQMAGFPSFLLPSSIPLCLSISVCMKFPGGSDCKESAHNTGDLGLVPGLGRSPGGGHGSPLQCSCLENPMDRGAFQATVHGVAKIGHDWVTKHSVHVYVIHICTHTHTPHFYLLSHQKVGTCFHILAIVSNAALNMKKRFFCKMVMLFPTHIYPEVGVSSHMAVLISWGTSMLFSIAPYQFTFPPTVQNWSLSFISLMTLIACGFDTGHSNMWSNSLLQFYFAFHWLAIFCTRWMYIKET